MDKIKEIKERINIVDLISKYVQLRKRGSNYTCLCPFHKEKTPSFTVSEEKQIFKCFGCDVKGDVFNFLMEYKKISFQEAMQELDIDSIPVSQYNSTPTKQETIKPIYKPKAEHIKIYTDFWEFCEKWVTKEHYTYLVERGLNPESIERFKIFSISKYSIINEWLRDNHSQDLLTSSGLVNEKGNLIFYFHRIIIPYIENGQITYLRGRYFFQGSPVTNDNKYIGLKGQPVKRYFNIDTIKNLLKDDIVYITEGEFDTMLLTQLGYNSLGLPGANSFNKEMALQLLDFNITLCLDSDTAGKEATDKIAEIFYTLGNRVKIRHLPENRKDITDYLTG